MVRVVSLLILILVGLLPLRAQTTRYASLVSSPVLQQADSGKLSIQVDMVGFFKNNEYFSPVAVGQTLPGVASVFALRYQLGGVFKAEAGAYAVKYSGREPFEDMQPFVRLQYSITPYLHLVMGNLYGGINHRLIEPMYQWERHFTANPESGIQALLHTNHWFADIWVDWQHFIKRGDPVPEVLTFGTSVAWRIKDDDSRFNFTIPLQLLIYHRGGQIDTSEEPMVVLGNLATGLSMCLRTDHKWVRSLGLDLYAVGYWNQYSNKIFRPYDEGLGYYPVFTVDAFPFKFVAGYWHAHKYYAFEGEPLFGSFDPYNPEQQLRIRNLLIFKIIFDKQIFKGVTMGARVETYSDLNRDKTDYSFGIHLRFNQLFHLKLK